MKEIDPFEGKNFDNFKSKEVKDKIKYLDFDVWIFL